MEWMTERSEIESSQGQVFIFSKIVQSGPGTNPTSDAVGIGTRSSGVERPGREANHSSQISAEI
jgi:hypothetical protein